MRIWWAALLFCSSTAAADIAGRLRFEGQSFQQPPSPSLPQEEGSVEFELEAAHDWNEHWGFSFEPRLRLSSVSHEADTAWDGDFRDTSLNYKTDSWRLQLGSFMKIWEGTDGVNPMDIASMKNLRDPLSGDSLGSWGLALSGGQTVVTWDALYVPWQTLPRLPGDNSAWLPRHTDLPLEADNEQLLVPADPQYQILPHTQINQAWQNNFGGRLQFHGSAWDLSFAYFEGASQIPALRPYVSGDLVETAPLFIVQMTNPIQIQPVDYRRRTISAGFVYTKDSWVFRLATRHEQPLGDDPILPGWWDQSVAAVEKTFTMGEQTLIWSLIYSYENHSNQSLSILASPDPFEDSIMSGLRWPINDYWLLSWMGLWDTKYGSQLERLTVQRKLGDHWSTEVSGDWYHGADDTLLGLWQEQSRGRVAGIFSF